MTILAGIAGLAVFILWIISIIKAFKANDVLWGVLTIFLWLPGLIYFFIKGHKMLGIYWIIAAVVIAVCGGSGLAGILSGLAPATP